MILNILLTESLAVLITSVQCPIHCPMSNVQPKEFHFKETLLIYIQKLSYFNHETVNWFN